MELIDNILVNNPCYRAGRTIKPSGIMVHSMGVAQPNPEVFIRMWDKPGAEVAVHALVGSEGVHRLLPWNWRGWHAGVGKNGQSANNTHISFEMLEPAGHTYQGGTMIGYDTIKNATYFADVYRNAVELTAHLCKLYRLDPLKPGVVICHSEGCTLGIASNHADVMHWFPKHKKSMDIFRADVSNMIKGEATMSEKEIDVLINKRVASAVKEAAPNTYKTLADVPQSYKATVRRLMEAKALIGHSDPDPTQLGDNIINISEDYCRVMTTLDRLGVLPLSAQKQLQYLSSPAT